MWAVGRLIKKCYLVSIGGTAMFTFRTEESQVSAFLPNRTGLKLKTLYTDATLGEITKRGESANSYKSR
jgi:hypothetical protein